MRTVREFTGQFQRVKRAEWTKGSDVNPVSGSQSLAEGRTAGRCAKGGAYSSSVSSAIFPDRGSFFSETSLTSESLTMVIYLPFAYRRLYNCIQSLTHAPTLASIHS